MNIGEWRTWYQLDSQSRGNALNSMLNNFILHFINAMYGILKKKRVKCFWCLISKVYEGYFGGGNERQSPLEDHYKGHVRNDKNSAK